MKKILSLSLIFLWILGCIGKSTGQNLSDPQKSTVERQVDSIFHFMVKAAETLDYDKISKGVDDRYHAGFITNDSYYAEYDSLISLLKARVQVGARQTIEIQKEKITVLSDRLALLTATGESRVEMSSGGSFTARFFWTLVYEKTGDSWKVIQSHQSGVR